MKSNTLKLTIIAILIIAGSVFQACNKDDDNPDKFHKNGIKILTHQKLNLDALSQYKINNESFISVNSIGVNHGIQGIDGTFYLLSGADNSEVYLESDDVEGVGETLIYVNSQNVTYFGEISDVEEVSDELIRIKGTLNDNNSNAIELNLDFAVSQTGYGSSVIAVEDGKAFISGTLGSITYNQILDINATSPNVKVFVLTNIQGSANDDVNVNTGRLIREAGYTTHLPSDGYIASGGVDLFTSGLKRTMETGGTIGVHSWCCYEGVTADKLPIDSPGHESQIAYFKEMLGNEMGPKFYFFTLDAAPFHEIHNMTVAEIEQYQLLTN